MRFSVEAVSVIMVLITLLSVALWKWYKYYHMSRAMMAYFADKIPDVDTFNAWFNWAEHCTIRKLLRRGKPPMPHRTQDYHTATAARLDIERRLLEKHMGIAFADITIAADLDTRRSSLRFLRQHFGLAE